MSNASFSRGNLALLAAGQEVAIKGDCDGLTFTAVVMEIEGAARNTSSSTSYSDEYAELEGTIASVNNGQIALSVLEAEHVGGISAGSRVAIDSSGRWSRYGDASCLTVGVRIEAKGAMTDATTMSAAVIEIMNGCGSSGDDAHDDD